MDEDTSRRKNATGLTYLCLNVPTTTTTTTTTASSSSESTNKSYRGIEFGINLNCFQTGEKFKGVKMLPGKGRLHFTFTGTRTTENSGARVGEFLCARKEGEVEIRRWDEKDERLRSSVVSCGGGGALSRNGEEEEEEEAQKERLILGVKRGDFDAHLGAYEEDSREDLRWRSLVSMIDVACLKRCKVEPGVMFVPGGVGRCLDEYGRKKRLTRDEGAKDGNEDEDVDMRTARFTFEATTRAPEDASAEILTKIHVDGRFRFERALRIFGGNREAMLAEHQLAYVLFFTFGCGKGLEQWKELTVIIANVIVEFLNEEVERKTSSEQSVMSDVRMDDQNGEKDWSSFFVGFLDSLEVQFNDDATNEGTLDEVISELSPSSSRDEKQLSDILRDAISESLRVLASSPSFARDVDDAAFGWLARFETTAKRLLRLKIFKKRASQGGHDTYPAPLVIDHDAKTEDEQPLIVELSVGEYARMDKDEDEIEVVEDEAEDKNPTSQNEIETSRSNRMSWMVQ